MDGLGLGPNGPPIPPPVTFSVIPYPVRRHSPFALDSSLHYVFVSSGPNDPNVAVEEKVKKSEPEIEKADSRSEKVNKFCVRGMGFANLNVVIIWLKGRYSLLRDIQTLFTNTLYRFVYLIE